MGKSVQLAAGLAAALLAAAPLQAVAGTEVLYGTLDESNPTFTITLSFFEVGFGSFEFSGASLQSVRMDFSSTATFRQSYYTYLEVPFSYGCGPVAVGSSCSVGVGHVDPLSTTRVDFRLSEPIPFLYGLDWPEDSYPIPHRTGPGVTKFTFAFDPTSGPIEYRLDFTAFAVPEPATWAMLVAGFGAVGSALRRRQSLSIHRRT